jgi:hypothetical protein
MDIAVPVQRRTSSTTALVAGQDQMHPCQSANLQSMSRTSLDAQTGPSSFQAVSGNDMAETHH